MKIAYRYIACILLAGCFNGCDTTGNIVPRDADFFVKYYGSSGNQHGEEMKVLADGYIIIGSSDSSGVNSDIYVVRTDLLGNELWRNNFGRDSNDSGKAIAETANGFVIVGNSQNDLGNTDILVITVNNEGLETNRTVLGDPSFNDEAEDVIITQDGNILIAGSSSNVQETVVAGGGTFDFYCPQLQLDLSPIPNWVGRHGFEGEDKAVSVQQKENGNFLFLGTTDKNEPDGSEKAQTNMIMIEVSGNDIGLQDITFGTGDQEEASDISSTSDGGYLIVGSSSSSDNFSQAFISRIRQDNSVLGSFIKINRDNVTGKSIHESQGGGSIVVGNITTTTGSDIYMSRISNNGEIFWERTFGNSGDNTAGDIVQLEDGSFVFTGTVTLDNQSKICLIKTNSNGDLSPL
jgi:hypothetical protein